MNKVEEDIEQYKKKVKTLLFMTVVIEFSCTSDLRLTQTKKRVINTCIIIIITIIIIIITIIID